MLFAISVNGDIKIRPLYKNFALLGTLRDSNPMYEEKKKGKH